MILSFGRINLDLFKDAEYQITLIQKRCPNLKIMWSLDTCAYRNYHPIHPSCVATESVFYFPTFDKTETLLSTRRIALSTNKKITSEIFELSGGLAGLFHGLISEGETYLCKPKAEEVINIVSQELTLSPELSPLLSTPSLREFVSRTKSQAFWFENIKLKRQPSGQELTILKKLNQNPNKHITRDDIAETFWGEQWQKRYSDWAIDKAISRLRQNINSKAHRLITIKRVGYSLLCTQN